ncbi:hypothetical protein Ddc_12826 [Ditylenchus destructor]|nr:hypothetical protein Ddc_12826 [Ditylenchus destructor]
MAKFSIVVVLLGLISVCKGPTQTGPFKLNFYRNGMTVVPEDKASAKTTALSNIGCPLSGDQQIRVPSVAQVAYDNVNGYREIEGSTSSGSNGQTLEQHVKDRLRTHIPEMRKAFEIERLRKIIELEEKNTKTQKMLNTILAAQKEELTKKNVEKNLTIFSQGLENGALKNLLDIALEEISRLEQDQVFSRFMMESLVYVMSQLENALDAKEAELKKQANYCQWLPFFRIFRWNLNPKNASAGAAKAIMGFLDKIGKEVSSAWNTLPTFAESMVSLASSVQEFYENKEDAAYFHERAGMQPM